MTTELSPQSRIKVLDIPVAAPGTCILCGIAEGRKFIDFGKQVDWIGAIYFCSECIGEAARAVGYIPVAEFNDLLREFKNLEVEKDTIVAKYSGVTSALDILFANYSTGIVSVDEFVSNSKNVDISDGLDKEFAVGEPEIDESSNVEGPDDVFDDSDFE